MSKKRLGSDPFDFIQSTTKPKQQNSKKQSTESRIVWKRATFMVREEYLEKIKDISYWDRIKIKDVLDQALKDYIQKREKKEAVKRREK